MHYRRNVNLQKRHRSHTVGGVAAVLCLLLTLLPLAAHGEIRIIAAAQDPDTATLVQTVQSELSGASAAVQRLDARVTIGAAAFREALAQEDSRPLVATYLTSVEFEEVLNGRERPAHVTAVYSNPDPVAQTRLARQLLGRATLGAFDSAAAHSLVNRVTSLGVRPVPTSRGQSIDSLLRSAQSLDALIVLPDVSVLNRSNINHAVRTLYQQRKVLIGHSLTLSRVGALASVYASREAVARGVLDVFDQYSTTGVLPEPVFVRDVDVVVNDRLAHSLNISVPDHTSLLKAVRSSPAESTP
jgi:putative tryptophan/tyrosine transport system substrate-binding protein